MKHTLFAIPMALLLATSAFADQRIDHTVTITATVPTDAFYVEPLGGNWMNDPQNMSYRPFDATFEPVRKQLSMKSTTGAIQAKMLNLPAMTSGTDTIGLDVVIAGKKLNLTSQPVVLEADAKNGAVVDFMVAAVKPTTGFKPGNYQGIVNMVFETPDP